MPPQDHYKVLGVDRKATRRRSRRPTASSRASTTPTSNPGDEKAEERFKEISQAHDVLGDPEKRKDYDRGCPTRSRRPGAAARASPGSTRAASATS